MQEAVQPILRKPKKQTPHFHAKRHQNQLFCEQKRLTEYKNRRNKNGCKYPEYQDYPPSKKGGEKGSAFHQWNTQSENCVSNKTQTPCPGLSLALRTTSEKDLFPSAILKEMNAKRDAGLLLI